MYRLIITFWAKPRTVIKVTPEELNEWLPGLLDDLNSGEVFSFSVEGE